VIFGVDKLHEKNLHREGKYVVIFIHTHNVFLLIFQSFFGILVPWVIIVSTHMNKGFFCSYPKRIIVALLTAFSLMASCGVLFSASTPTTISYQGYLTNASGTPQTGSSSVTVRIYDAQTGGTLLYEETHPSVTITSGFFTVAIGSVGDVNGGTSAVALTDLPFDQSYYVTVELGAPYNTGEMTLGGGLRSLVNATPFAMVSYGAVTSTSSTGLVSAKGKMYFNTNDNQLYVYNGSSWTALSAGSGLTSLNGLTGVSQFFSVAQNGTDISLTSTGTTHTLSIPNAGALSRGVVSTSTQTFSGDKTFSGTTTLANLSLTAGTSTSFFSTLLTAVTGVFTGLTSVNATTTNLVASNSTSSNSFRTVT
jgi:hypothetical protein